MTGSEEEQSRALSQVEIAAPESEKERALFMSVSPKAWGLACSREEEDSSLLREMGLSKDDLEERAYRNTQDWLPRQFKPEQGAFAGFYDVRSGVFSEPQTVNLIAPFQLVAAYDRYQDDSHLEMARSCCDWMEAHMLESHPMSLVLGGVRDNIRTDQLWTKYTADYVIQNLALYQRQGDEELLARAIRSSKFLLQAQNHGFAPKYDHTLEDWVGRGWNSFGRVVVAMIGLDDIIQDEDWLDRATLWADNGVALQASNGCFRLINDNYYSSDIAADEIRGLIRLSWRTGRKKYLEAAVGYADWHVENQLPAGAWPLSIDHAGVTVGEYVGPGDVPNIAISLLMVHRATGEMKYLVSAVRAMRYSLTQQLLPGQDWPHGEDENAVWGFWSWDPRYDCTMSPDQSTHHVRGYWFFLDYFYSLDSQTQQELAAAARPEAPEDQDPAARH